MTTQICTDVLYLGLRKIVVNVYTCIKSTTCTVSHLMTMHSTRQLHYNSHLALSISSFSLGTPRCTSKPRFILAGSKAQFDMPMNATFL